MDDRGPTAGDLGFRLQYGQVAGAPLDRLGAGALVARLVLERLGSQRFVIFEEVSRMFSRRDTELSCREHRPDYGGGHR